MANNFNPYGHSDPYGFYSSQYQPMYNHYNSAPPLSYLADLSQPIPVVQHPQQPQESTFNTSTTPSTSSTRTTSNTSTTTKSSTTTETSNKQDQTENSSQQQSRARWQFEDEKFLVQLWADNFEKLESKDSRKTWEHISKALKEKRGTTKTVDQCQRKIKHLKTLYKERKDWNRRQTGGNIRKSPHYDAIDEVLGCKDSITCKNIEQMGTSSRDNSTESSAGNDTVAEEASATYSSAPSPAASTTSSSSSSAASKRRERKRNKGRKRSTVVDSDSEDDTFKKAVKKMNEEGDQMTRIMDNMQQSQTQQLQLMTQLLTSFNRYMDAKSTKKE